MSLYQVSSGQTINSLDINQIVQVLQQQSGGQELGTYFLTGMGLSGITALGAWVPSQSRNSNPVSVTINTSIQSPSNCTAPNTFHLSSYGFQVACQYSANNTAANVAGLYTLQF